MKKEIMIFYIDFQFRGNLMQRIHDQYKHLSYANLVNILKSWIWWLIMKKDLHQFIIIYFNCQIHQCQYILQEKKYTQSITNLFIQSFQWWEIDLIERLSKTSDDNRWIIIAIDYTTNWFIIKTILKMIENVITKFIHDEIYIHYDTS